MEHLMQNLKFYRERAKLNQEEAAERLGVSQAQYSRYESEPNKITQIDLLFKIKISFGISDDEFREVISEFMNAYESNEHFPELDPGIFIPQYFIELTSLKTI